MTRSLTLLTLALVVLAVACGDSSDDETQPEETQPEETQPEETQPDGPLGSGPFPVATIEITVTHPDADDVEYTISCLGDTATVIGDVDIDEVGACTALGSDEVRARLVDGAPPDQVCTEQYGGPDLANIVGSYDGVGGVPVDTVIDRTNGCGISDWDVLLADVLPPAIGITE